MTNADKIRDMTDVELAEFLPSKLCPPSGKKYKSTECPTDARIRNCADCWLDWLKQEVKDNA